MQNDTIDFQTLKRVNHFNPLFQHCTKAIPTSIQNPHNTHIADIKKSFYYMVIPEVASIEQKVFECKSICPVFNKGSESFILVKGDNLWDFYRARKENEIILTEQELWILLKQVAQALMHLQQHGYLHTHLKQYAIYRQSSYSYQLVFHPSIQSMLSLSQSSNFYWYNFYLTPEELKFNSRESTYVHTQKQSVFALGLLMLNVMNAQYFHQDVYSRKNYEVDWQIVRFKLHNCKRKYSQKLINLVSNCLKQSKEQRYGLKEVQNEIIMAMNNNRMRTMEFKAKFEQLLVSKQRQSYRKQSSPKIFNSDKKVYGNSSEKKKQISSPRQQSTNLESKEKGKENPTLYVKKQSNKLVMENSPPKKWKVQQASLQKPYSISKGPVSISKDKYSNSKEQIDKSKRKSSNENNDEDVINFQRGTFGGQQSSQFSSFSSNKFKNEIRIQIEQKQVFVPNFPLAQPEIQQEDPAFQRQKLVTFGSMNLHPQNNENSSIDSLDSQINILDSRKFEQKEEDKKELQPSFQKIHQNPIISRVNQIQNESRKDFSLENLKSESDNFHTQQFKLKRIQLSIDSQQKKIALNLKDCLKPIQELKKLVSQSPGVYIDGNLYFGSFKHGRRKGLGLEIFPQNEYYLGNFENDLFHGDGFYFWYKNEYFLGIFQNGKKVFGHLYGPKLHYLGQFFHSKKMNGFGKAKFKNGEEYIGQWTEGKRHGTGMLTQITKDKFIGFWRKGKKTGYGQHTSFGYPQQGYKLKAFWQEHQIISEAIIKYCNGNVYEGSLNDFEKHGKGLFTFKKGGYFKGTFYKDNATHGQLMYKNGQKYVGSLKNMKRHGFGQYHYLDGTIKKGNWIQDIRVEKQVDPSTLK